MIRLLTCCACFVVVLLGCQPSEPPADLALYSPDQRIKVEVSLDPADSSLSYQVEFKRGEAYATVVKPSRLGLIADEASGDRRDLSRGFDNLTVSETTEGTETYQMLIGKRRQHEAAYQEKAYTLTHQGDSLTLRFRVFNDGLGFRYAWSGAAGQSYTIQDELLVNFHGCTLPRGWSRTYPHLLAMEAVFGAEAYKFAERYPAYAPTQNTILPFTRNVVGPMDFTPVTLSESTYPSLTTAAHELALPVVFESGLLHLADRPEVL